MIDAGKNQTIVCGGSAKLGTDYRLTRIYSDTTDLFTSVFFIGEDTGYLVGSMGNLSDYWGGIILKTTDGGNSWIKQMDTLNLNSVYFTDANTGYAVGQLGIIMKTEDGGNHWNLKANVGYFDNYLSIFFTSRDTGFAAGVNGKILKTTNGGAGWEVKNYDSTLTINSIYFPDKNTGYAVGFDPRGGICYFLKSTDAGNNWTRMNDTLHYELQSVYFTDADTGYITGIERFPNSYNLYSDILKTTDGGKSWKVVKKVSGVTLYSLRFLDEKNGYAAGSKGTLIKTSDGGNSWETIVNNVTLPYSTNSFVSIYFSHPNEVIVAGWQTGICKLLIPDSYSWYPAIGMNDTSLAEPTVSPVKNTTYTVNAKFKSGCIAVDSVKVTVSPLLAYANDIVVSCGNNANLGASSNYTGNGALKYIWSPAENLSDSSISNPVASVIKSSVYSVEITTPNGCRASKDVNISTSAVNIQPSICMVTVGDKYKNLVVWEKPVSNSIDSFLIYRESTNQTGLYELIGKLPYYAQSVFVDTSSNSLVQSNRYKIAIKDVCENKTALSPAHKTMHLNINQAQGSSWNLIWEEYEGFAVSSYKIYRGTTISDLRLIGSTAGGNSSYTDFLAPAGDIFYQVEVLPPNSCSNIKSNNYTSSRSNIASNTALNIFGQTANSIGFKAYPVPAKEELFFNLPVLKNAKVSISSIDGKFIMYSSISNTQNSLSLTSLPQGMYILRIMDNRNTYVTKFIKE